LGAEFRPRPVPLPLVSIVADDDELSDLGVRAQIIHDEVKTATASDFGHPGVCPSPTAVAGGLAGAAVSSITQECESRLCNDGNGVVGGV
jgi:hypothetical protein